MNARVCVLTLPADDLFDAIGHPFDRRSCIVRALVDRDEKIVFIVMRDSSGQYLFEMYPLPDGV